MAKLASQTALSTHWAEKVFQTDEVGSGRNSLFFLEYSQSVLAFWMPNEEYMACLIFNHFWHLEHAEDTSHWPSGTRSSLSLSIDISEEVLVWFRRGGGVGLLGLMLYFNYPVNYQKGIFFTIFTQSKAVFKHWVYFIKDSIQEPIVWEIYLNVLRFHKCKLSLPYQSRLKNGTFNRHYFDIFTFIERRF